MNVCFLLLRLHFGTDVFISNNTSHCWIGVKIFRMLEAEMETAADAADMSVLFFSAGANF